MTLLPVDVAEVEQRVDFGCGLAGVDREAQSVGVDGQAVRNVAANNQVAESMGHRAAGGGPASTDEALSSTTSKRGALPHPAIPEWSAPAS